MQIEERNKLEERILAYFDGGLNGSESSQLLAEVSTDAEKQSLFTSHETLDRLLNAARTPLETPLLVQKSLAEKIPGLLTYLPGLIGAAETVPLLTSGSNTILSLFAKIPLSTALTIGTSIAVLTTAGIIIKNNLDQQSSAGSSRSAVVRQHDPIAAIPKFAERVPANNPSGTDVGLQSANPRNSVLQTPQNIPSHTLSVGASRQSKPIHSFVAVNNHTPNLGSLRYGLVDVNAEKRIPLRVKLVQNAVTQMDAITTTNDVSNIRSKLNENVVNPVVPSSDVAGISTVDVRTVETANALTSNSATVIKIVPSRMSQSSTITFRPFGQLDINTLFVPAARDAIGKSIPSTTISPLSPRLGVDLLVDDQLSLRIQGGYQSFGQITNSSYGITSSGGLNNFVYYSYINSVAALWTTGGVAYTLNPIDQMPVTLQVSGGAAFLPQAISPMAQVGLNAEVPMGSNWVFRPGISYSAAWVGAGPPDATIAPTGAIVQHRELNAPPSLFNSIMSVSIGVMLRY